MRRIERGIAYTVAGEVADEAALRRALHDRMTESVLDDAERRRLAPVRARRSRGRSRRSRSAATARAALERANRALGLALAPDEIDYLLDALPRARPRSRPTSS